MFLPSPPSLPSVKGHLSFKAFLEGAQKLFLLLLLLFSLEFFLYHLIFLKRVIPGVSLSAAGERVELSGKTFKQTQALFEDRIDDYLKQPLSLKIGLVERPITLAQIGVEFDASQSAQRAYALGRSRNLFSDLATEYRALILGVRVDPVFRVDEIKLKSFQSEVSSQLATREAALVWEEDRLKVKPAQAGLTFSVDDLSNSLYQALSSFRHVVEVEVVSGQPRVTEEHLQSLLPELDRLRTARTTFYYGTQEWSLTDEQFLALFDFPNSTPSALMVSPKQLSAFVAKVAGAVNVPSRAISFKVEAGRVTSFEPGSDGLSVDEAVLSKAVAEAVLAGSSLRLLVPVNRLHPSVASNDYGIKELIGEGVSNFAGSIPGRRHNIQTAAKRLNGLLIPPDKIFSFNESVGEISAATGYDYAYIISEGRTVLGTGGGVCQVSTTVFRAAVNAGLPILKRTAHAYRVHYYEEGGSPIGFDSTVFAPSVDLQFKNDTGNYILVQTVLEDDKDTLIFRFYGTKDGRTVKIEGPVTLSSSPAPEPLYQDDPTLPKGTVRQIDFAASGATVYFKRVVEKDGQNILDDTFYSRYSPWRAIYLVGTKE